MVTGPHASWPVSGVLWKYAELRTNALAARHLPTDSWDFQILFREAEDSATAIVWLTPWRFASVAAAVSAAF